MKTTNWWVFLMCLYIGFGTSVNAQFSCGTLELSPFEKTELSIALQNNNQKKIRRASYSIAINAVIVQPDNGQSFFGNDEVNQLINNANKYFNKIGIQFYLRNGRVLQINDSNLQEFHVKNESKLRKENDRLDAINIYFVKNITRDDGSFLNGYTNLPGYSASTNRLIFSYQDNNLEDFITLRDKTFLHELGHYFGLLHTFQDSNEKDITMRELVSRTSYANCGYTGDEICDTPADPFELLKSVSVYNCDESYPADLLDANGQAFVPFFDNIMSYHLRCGNNFTEQQYQRMEASLGIRLSPKAEYQITISDPNFISVKPLENKVYCAGQNITLNLAISGLFDTKNTFSAELTNENGESFQNIYSILYNDSLRIKLPDNLKPGLNYRFRVHSSNPNIYSFPTQGIQIKSKGKIKLSTPSPIINLGDHAELKIEMTSNGPWNFTLSNGNLFENIMTPEFKIYVNPENNTTFKILKAENECATEIENSEVEIQVVQPNITIDDSFLTNHCKNETVQVPVKGLDINHIKEYKVVLEGTSKSFLIEPYVSTLSLNFNLPFEIESEEIYKIKIQGKGFGDFSLFKTINIYSNPSQPKIISPIKLCFNSKAENLKAEGSNLKWYYSANSNTSYDLIMPNTANEGLQFYYVSQTSINGCESDRSKIEVEVKTPVSGNISGNNTIISGDSTGLKFNLTGEAPWQIELENGFRITSNSPTFNYYVKPANSTLYTLKRVSNSCGNGQVSGEAKVVVLIPLATEKSQMESMILFPVPAHEYLDIALKSQYSGICNVTLINIMGQQKLFETLRFENGISRLQLPNLYPGFYVLKTNVEGQNLSKQIILK